MAISSELSQFIAVLKKTLSEVQTIRNQFTQTQQETRVNFNFFYGLVYDKAHLEKYHSNFIRYLLDPSESHHCQHFFARIFLNTLKANTHDIALPEPI